MVNVGDRMLLRIEIPAQEREDWFKIETTFWITTSVISTCESESLIEFLLDPRVVDFTTDVKTFTLLKLNKFLDGRKYTLYATFVVDEEDDLDYFDGIQVASVEVVKSFPSPLFGEES